MLYEFWSPPLDLAFSTVVVVPLAGNTDIVCFHPTGFIHRKQTFTVIKCVIFSWRCQQFFLLVFTLSSVDWYSNLWIHDCIWILCSKHTATSQPLWFLISSLEATPPPHRKNHLTFWLFMHVLRSRRRFWLLVFVFRRKGRFWYCLF
jgi:hypothetical protein